MRTTAALRLGVKYAPVKELRRPAQKSGAYSAVRRTRSPVSDQLVGRDLQPVHLRCIRGVMPPSLAAEYARGPLDEWIRLRVKDLDFERLQVTAGGTTSGRIRPALRATPELT